jgi:hypothetical protein
VEENDSESEDDETRNFKDNLLLNKFKEQKKADNRPFALNKNNSNNEKAQQKSSQKQPVKQSYINK